MLIGRQGDADIVLSATSRVERGDKLIDQIESLKDEVEGAEDLSRWLRTELRKHKRSPLEELD